jgi:hypothetical protein
MKKLHHSVRQWFAHRRHFFYCHRDDHGHGDQTQTVSVVNDYKKNKIYSKALDLIIFL